MICQFCPFISCQTTHSKLLYYLRQDLLRVRRKNEETQINQDSIVWCAGSVGQEELDKIEAVLYIMADKFLESAEMDELMEVVGMTRLGQKLVNREIQELKKEVQSIPVV